MMPSSIKTFRSLGNNRYIGMLLCVTLLFGGCGGGGGGGGGGGDSAKVWYNDADGDGYGDAQNKIKAKTQPAEYVDNDLDCDDTDANIHPEATEVCGDGIDQDCNGKDLECDPDPNPIEWEKGLLWPGNWKEGDLEKFLELQNTYPENSKPVEGKNGMISGTSSAAAVRAGLEALNKGGTAADAAMTTALAQISLVAGSYVSYAGILFVTYYDAREGKVYYLNAGFNTPLNETDPLSIPSLDSGNPSGRTALVPGFMAGLAALHQRFGKLSFTSIFEPAIYFAENGFEVNPALEYYINWRKDVISRHPETKKIFTKEDGTFYKAGDWITQPELAKTLKNIASQGVEYCYSGEWAQNFVQAVQADGGKITMEDMTKYQEIWSDPFRTSYGRYEIYAPGLPSYGGANTVLAFNVFETSKLKDMGKYTESPEAFFWFSQIQRLFMLGNVSKEFINFFGLEYDISPQTLAKKETAPKVWESIKNNKLYFLIQKPKTNSSHSDAIVAVDQWGDIASVVHTINCAVWGETGIFVDGISIPDAANYQQQRIKDTGPGNRLPEEINPVIVFRDDTPYLAAASIGTGLFQRSIAGLYNMLEYDKDLDEASEAPFLLFPLYEASTNILEPGYKERVIKGDFKSSLLSGVRNMGLPVLEIDVSEHQSWRGYWVAIRMNPENGSLLGVTSDFLNGAVLSQDPGN